MTIVRLLAQKRQIIEPIDFMLCPSFELLPVLTAHLGRHEERKDAGAADDAHLLFFLTAGRKNRRHGYNV